jgi:FecR protein
MSEREQRDFMGKIREHLPLAKAPDSIWPSIEAALDQKRVPAPSRVSPWRWAFAAAAAMVLLALLYWRVTHRSQWIETDDHSRVTVKVGEIGSVEVEPGTRLRIVTERPNEHRFALAHGAIRATISAPPKLFFVDTASGTAVDLGCEYALNANELGLGLLRVTKGWVSFQWKGMESLVPAGASCRTHPGTGPGIPYFDDAPESLKQALENFGNEKDGSATLDVILSAARIRDTLSLWHLLQRVDVSDRARVYDRIAALTPVPAGVSRQRALQLDPATLRLWKDELAWKW